MISSFRIITWQKYKERISSLEWVSIDHVNISIIPLKIQRHVYHWVTSTVLSITLFNHLGTVHMVVFWNFIYLFIWFSCSWCTRMLVDLSSICVYKAELLQRVQKDIALMAEYVSLKYQYASASMVASHWCTPILSQVLAFAPFVRWSFCLGMEKLTCVVTEHKVKPRFVWQSFGQSDMSSHPKNSYGITSHMHGMCLAY